MKKLEEIEKNTIHYEPRKIIYYALWATTLCFIYGAVMTIVSYYIKSPDLPFNFAIAGIAASLIFFIVSVFYREKMREFYQK